MLIKKYAEKNKNVRMETTEAFKHLLKVTIIRLSFQIFRIRGFLELLMPYLQYPNFNIKQEIMNLMVYSFINSKGKGSFDSQSIINSLAQVLRDDKNIRVRFIAMEALAYITTIEGQEKVLKIVNQELQASGTSARGVYSAIQKRFKLHPRVKINSEDQVEYPNLCN